MSRWFVWGVVLIVVALCQGQQETSSTISYQIHSFNDLREWRQLLHKGATWFKIDPHWMDVDFCRLQENDYLHSDNGCFVLSHDRPVSLRRNYNTTSNVLELLGQNWIRPFVSGESRLHIALCFKTKGFSACDGSKKAQQWTSLVNDLFDSYTAFVDANGLNVEFVLDGAGTAGGGRTCLQEFWKPWNYTWIIHDDPDAAFVSNSAEDALDRFQIMNTPVPDNPGATTKLAEEGSRGYGKFQESSYPFLNWEPSDQMYIWAASDYYLETNIIHDPGFLFAINIDPVQFDVFAGTRSGMAWNVEFANMTDSLIVAIPTSNSSTLQFLLLGSSASQGQGWYLLTASEPFAPLQSQYLGGVSFSGQAVALSLSNSQEEGVLAVLLWGSTGAYQVYHFNVASQKIVMSTHGQWISQSAIGFSYGVLVAESSASVRGTYQIMISSIASDCPAGLWSATITASGGIQTQHSLCLSTNSTISNISTTAVVATSSESTEFCQLADAAIGVVFLSDGNSTVSGQIYCVDQSTGQIRALSLTSSSPFDVGSSPNAVIARQNGTLIIMEVHTDGYCWNNEFDNKRPEPGLCDSTPRSTSYVLNYNYGTLSRWISLLESESMVTPCDEGILHGVYDMGGSPSVTSFSHQGNIGILDAHLGPSGLSVAGHCGSSVYTDNSLIIDGWMLPTLPQ